MISSVFNNNTIDVSEDDEVKKGGNTCLNSVSAKTKLVVKHSTFIHNIAFSECNCFKFSGLVLNITNSTFKNNSNVKYKLSLDNEGGSMNIGPGDLFFLNVNLTDSYCAKGAGIFLNNRLSRKKQNMLFINVKIERNSGLQTAAMDFDVSLLEGLLQMNQCSIKDNIVDFYGSMSTFYYTAFNMTFFQTNFTNNIGKSVTAVFSCLHFGGIIKLNQSTFRGNQLNKDTFIGGPCIFLLGSTKLTKIRIYGCYFIDNYSNQKAGAYVLVWGNIEDRGSTFITNFAPYGGCVNVVVLCRLLVDKCTFIGNHTLSILGGGLLLNDETDITITNSILSKFNADRGGCFNYLF